MSKTPLKAHCRLLIAKCLIKFGRLKYVEYNTEELDQLILPHLPNSFTITVPKGDGLFTLTKVKTSLPAQSACIQAQLQGNLEISFLANPIYKGHILITLQAMPWYDMSKESVKLSELSIINIQVIDDEYSIIKDTTSLINQLVPQPMLSVMKGTMQTAFNLMTGSTTADANAYLQMYLSGNKQRVLDYHRPQLENILAELAANENLQYCLDPNDFEENLFIHYGKEVKVENGNLRFKF